jgi:hypothetical protein
MFSVFGVISAPFWLPILKYCKLDFTEIQRILGERAEKFKKEAQARHASSQPNPQSAVGDGTKGPYYIRLPYFPALPGHIDLSGLTFQRNV